MSGFIDSIEDRIKGTVVGQGMDREKIALVAYAAVVEMDGRFTVDALDECRLVLIAAGYRV